MAEKTVKQARKETEALRGSVRGMLQDRVYAGKKIPPGSYEKFPKLNRPGSLRGRNAELETINADGNPCHYAAHLQQKGKAKVIKRKKK